LVKNSREIQIGKTGFGVKEIATRRLGLQSNMSISMEQMGYSTKTITLWS